MTRMEYMGPCDGKTFHDNELWHYAMHRWLYTKIENTCSFFLQKNDKLIGAYLLKG